MNTNKKKWIKPIINVLNNNNTAGGSFTAPSETAYAAPTGSS